jgi:AAA15 family ATPase/GTPase
VILIDEIESGLHHSALPEIWRGLLTACESSDVQIFATTHSWECVSAAHMAFSESLEYPLAVFRLEERQGNIEAVTYDRESLEYSIEQEWEVR